MWRGRGRAASHNLSCVLFSLPSLLTRGEYVALTLFFRLCYNFSEVARLGPPDPVLMPFPSSACNCKLCVCVSADVLVRFFFVECHCFLCVCVRVSVCVSTNVRLCTRVLFSCTSVCVCACVCVGAGLLHAFFLPFARLAPPPVPYGFDFCCVLDPIAFPSALRCGIFLP